MISSAHPRSWALCYPIFFPSAHRDWDHWLRHDSFPAYALPQNLAQNLEQQYHHSDDEGVVNNAPGPANDGKGDSDLDDENPDRENDRLAVRGRRVRITLRMFWAFHLQYSRRVRISDDPTESQDYNSHLLHGHRLTQQLMFHIYPSILANNLDWLRNDNEQFRRDQAAGVMDALAGEGGRADRAANNAGRAYILLSSFVGGDRWLHKIF